jgi:MoaA/NifB/PqqE/SkfB family radical SAM enzyme
MFRFDELDSVHLEITSACQASCPMCARNNHGGLPNDLLHEKSWTLAEFKSIFTNELIDQISSVYFCGNFGDPILNKDLPKMCLYLKEHKPTMRVAIHTNGGARNSDWWEELYHSLPENHRIVFALDGLEDTHHLYRIGTTYNGVIKNAKTFINAGGIAEWCFIKFKHNEHQENEARARANQSGFKYFTLKNSSRFLGEPKFDVFDKAGNITHVIEPPSDNKMHFISKHMIEEYKSTIMPLEINCKVQHSKEIYIDHFKNVFPCCWVGSIPYTNYDNKNVNLGIRNEINKQYFDLVESLGGEENLNADLVGVRNIIQSNNWQNVWEIFWTTKKMIMCARICGVDKNISKPDDQFLQRDQFN